MFKAVSLPLSLRFNLEPMNLDIRFENASFEREERPPKNLKLNHVNLAKLNNTIQ